MQAPGTATLVMLALVPLVLWRIYSRVRRLVGRQRLSRVRPWITLAVFPLLILLLAWFALPRPEPLAWLGGGLAGGALLALYGLRMTRFEPTPEGLFYTPNVHLGIALSLLFIGRVIYRIVEVALLGHPNSGIGFVQSYVTLSIFGLLAGYYIAYAIGLVRWRFAVLRAKRQRDTSAGQG
jgi:hypothetical protein